MIWPGMGDPYKRKRTLKFLAITAIIAVSVGLGSTVVQGQFSQNDPLKACIEDRETPFKIKATLEIVIDGLPTPIPANINVGLNDGECHRAMYTLTDDGTIYAEWEEEFPFHFLTNHIIVIKPSFIVENENVSSFKKNKLFIFLKLFFQDIITN